MNLRDSFLLFLLAGIWGGSFVFMRILTPVLGALATSTSRLLLGGVFLLCVLSIFGTLKKKGQKIVNWKRNFGSLSFLGIVNSAMPFSFYAIASLSIPASYSSIINACSPVFGALLSSLFLKETFSRRKLAALALGIVGVIVLVLFKQTSFHFGSIVSVFSSLSLGKKEGLASLLCIAAAFCYGLGGLFVKTKLKGVSGSELATGSSLLAGVYLCAFIAYQNSFSTFLPLEIRHLPQVSSFASLKILICTLALGILCSGVAYLIYFRLMQKYGPTKTLTVTYLMPLFGILWGWLFLQEHLSWNLWLGAACVLGSVWLTMKAETFKK